MKREMIKVYGRIAADLGTNNTPRVASLLKKGKIQYSTSGSPSCWSEWQSFCGIDDARRILLAEARRAGFGYTNIAFRIKAKHLS